MGGSLARGLALLVGTAAGCAVGAAVDRARRGRPVAAIAAPAPTALLAATSLAGTARTTLGWRRRPARTQLAVGFATGLALTLFGDAIAAALDG